MTVTSTGTRNPTTAGNGTVALPARFGAGADLSLLRLVVGWRPSKYSLQLRQVQLARPLRDALRDAARQTLDELARRTPVPYTAEITLTGDEYALADGRHLDPDSLLLDELGKLDYPSATRDDLEREFQFFAYVTGAPGNELVFVSKFNPRRGLRRKRIVRWVDEQLTDLQDPVLAFDPSGVDLVWAPPDSMAVLDLGVFEFLLRDAPEVVAKVPARVAQLAATLPFADGSADALATAALADSRLRRRLLAIVERGHLVGKTADDVRAALLAGGYRPAEFLSRDGLVVTPRNVTAVLQVLNEDILLGRFSGDRFAAERKAPA